jgi:magnesium chelatase family protein
MLATVTSSVLVGIEAHPVQVEVNTGQSGELRFILVGLPGIAVRESQDRVFSALHNSGFGMPTLRTTINLAPGHLRKEGPIYDLPIAIGLLAATGQIPLQSLNSFIIGGELSLSGETRSIKGAIAMALLARKLGKKGVILPRISAEEASFVSDMAVYPVDSLAQTVQFLNKKINISPLKPPQAVASNENTAENLGIDFSEIKGQKGVRRAAEVAVAGGHNLIMIGSPGTGKSMIAKRLATIMPPTLWEEHLEVLGIYSAAGLNYSKAFHAFQRPFRSPHHTISDVGLLGGGSIITPGEISLAHNGILFMDELPEFKRSALEVLRQPLEDGTVLISRSSSKVTLPCNFILIAAMNPCPCGYMGDKKRNCRCNPIQVQRYRNRISGPLLDRIDIHIEANTVSIDDIQSTTPAESSEPIRKRIADCRQVQKERFHNLKITTNAGMSTSQIRNYCIITKEQSNLLQKALEQLQLSARAYDRILKVARTIADLAKAETIQTHHLLEAIQYRSLDRGI